MNARPKILLVEDDARMRTGIRANLEIEGYDAHCVSTCAEARRSLRDFSPDLLLLDRMLPDGDGMDLCHEIRRNGFVRPVIVLTAKGEEVDRVFGLETGADDYIVKPFSLRELMARIRGALRRSGSLEQPEGTVRVGAADVDFQQHRLLREGVEVEISALELELLRYLHTRRGQVVSRAALLENVWGRAHTLETRTIDNFVARLRKKIEPDPSRPRVLLTVHGSGYKLLAN